MYMLRRANKVLNELAVTASKTSTPIQPGERSKMSIDVRANHGTGTQTLVGTLALQGTNNPEAGYHTCTEYTFAASPNGSAFRTKLSCPEALYELYQVVFTFTSGTGDLEINVKCS